MSDDAVAFEQDPEGLYVRLADVGRLRVVDCHTVEEWGDDVLVLLRCSRKAPDPAAPAPDRWTMKAHYTSGVRVWINETGQRKRTAQGEEP